MKQNKMTWRKTLALNHRTIKLLFAKFPSMVLSRFICAIWSAVTPYITIYLSALVVTSISAGSDIKEITTLVSITICVTAFCALVSAILKKWENAQNAGQPLKLEELFSEKLNDMDFEKVDDSKVHELCEKIKDNENGLGWGIYKLMDTYVDIINSVVSLIAGICMTVMLFATPVPVDAGDLVILNNPLFIVLIVAVMLIISSLSPWISYKANSYWAKHADDHATANNFFSFYYMLGFQEDVSADVRIYRQDLFSYPYFMDKCSTFSSNGLFAKLAKGKMGILQALSVILYYIPVAVIYLFVCLKAYAGAFGIGEVTQYIASLTKMTSALFILIGNVGTMKNNAVFLQQMFDFLDIPNDMYQGSLTVEKRSDRQYEIEFKNVGFKYPNTDFYALKNVNMKFKIGSRIAVVGMNGSGKTTFIKLLCRLYDPTEGEILLNGINIRKYNYKEYMNIFSVVFQDFKLFALKLGENVACSMNYDRQKAVDCLTKAGFGDKLATLNDGLDTYLYKEYDQNGISISGGEAQKIALARALYKNAPFIILDEPTAALDPVAEAEIYTKFNDIVQDKTAIYISHRLSSCKFCDEILVFDNGAVVEQGTHEQLLAMQGKYSELWNAQAVYYNK